MSDNKVPTTIIEALHELCSSYDEHSTIPSDAILTITSLKEAINQPGLSTNYNGRYDHKRDPDKSLFVFHHACNNENVTLEIIKFLLNNNIRSFPDAPRTLCIEFATLKDDETSFSETYPLHLACTKEYCPSDVIRFLIEQYPQALEHPSNINGGIGYDYDVYQVAGLPLHYYLARSRDIDLDTVKMMLEVYPQSLMRTGEEDGKECYPIHALLSNECTGNLQEILAYLVELNPSVIRMLDGYMKTPLHLACRNGNMTLEVVQYIFNKWPEAIRTRNERGWLPIHELCYNIDIEKIRLGALYEILQFMLDVDSTLVMEGDNSGYLPIHHAVDGMSTEFCKALIKAYPESISIESDNGSLPIHEACGNGYSYDITKTIRHLLELYPTSINARNGDGDMPIHCAARQFGRDYILELLLSYDPDGASKETEQRQLPLHLVCAKQHYHYEYLDMVKVLYEAYPEAITARDEDGNTPMQLVKDGKERVKDFLETQQAYARQAKDTAAMHTLDSKGWSPLHHALVDKAPLGTIKLLVKGNPVATRAVDDQFAFPLHVACEFSSAKVVKFLVELDINGRILEHCDTNKNSILHYTCHGGNLEVVKYLLDNHSSLVASAEMNGKGELPIHLLCEAGKSKVDCDSAEYIEIIWRMLLSNPEAVMS